MHSLHTDSDVRKRDDWFVPWVTMFTICLILTLSCEKTSWLNPVRESLYEYVHTPVRRILQSPLRVVTTKWRHWQTDTELLNQAETLQAQNNELRAQIQLMEYYQAENRRLRMLMDSVGSVTEPVLIAEIRDTNIEGYREIVNINKGSADGVYEQQAVIDPYGLVGQVIDVYSHEATVMLISDGRSRVPVYIERTHQRALLSGSSEDSVLSMSTLRLDSDIQVGDRLISSGLGGVFPRGYPVAEIISVVRDQRHSFLTVTLHPLAHLDSMLEVLLLDQRNVPDTPVLPVGPPRPLPVE